MHADLDHPWLCFIAGMPATRSSLICYQQSKLQAHEIGDCLAACADVTSIMILHWHYKQNTALVNAEQSEMSLTILHTGLPSISTVIARPYLEQLLDDFSEEV